MGGHRIFINFRGVDAGQAAARLWESLANVVGAAHVFKDSESILAGEDWKERLRQEIDCCTVFLCLIGARWLDSVHPISKKRLIDRDDDWVRFEIATALEREARGELKFVTLLVERERLGPPDASWDLDPSVKRLIDLQARPLRQDRREWEADVTDITDTLGLRPTRGTAAPAASSEARLSRYLDSVREQFRRYLLGKHGALGGPKDPCLDLVLRKRSDARPEGGVTPTRDTTLDDVIRYARTPVGVVAEGGGGKTTSFLRAAALAADRATAPGEPIPVYVDFAQLGRVLELPDLLAEISRATLSWTDGKELEELWRTGSQSFLFLFDSFNEVPEDHQRACVRVLDQFTRVHADLHRYIIGSRWVPQLEPLLGPERGFDVYEILRLTPERVLEFFVERGLTELHDQLPRELRDLARNPFMLFAITRTMTSTSKEALPRNRGQLYRHFTNGWMAHEADKRETRYSYDLVKRPLLVQMANRMTAAGRTTLERSSRVDQALEEQLTDIHRARRRRRSMPRDWSVDDCLEEILKEGLLQRVGDQLQFMHQSVQEYYAALAHEKDRGAFLVAMTPKLIWEQLTSGYELAEMPEQRFIGSLLMLVGLVGNATSIVESVLPRNALIAAACIGSATFVEPSTISRVEREWVEMLSRGIDRERWVACSCLGLARMRSPATLNELILLALASDHRWSRLASTALTQLGVDDAVAVRLSQRLLLASDEDFDEAKRSGATLLRELGAGIAHLFEVWRGAPPGSQTQRRCETLLASFERSLVTTELDHLRRRGTDVSAVERALAGVSAWEPAAPISAALLRRARQTFLERREREADALRAAPVEEVADALQGPDPGRSQAAALVIAEQTLPLTDELATAVLRRRPIEIYGEMLRVVLGADDAVSLLASNPVLNESWIATLPVELHDELLDAQKAPRQIMQALQVFGNSRSDYEIERSGDRWLVHTVGRLTGSPSFELRLGDGGLELHDCNARARLIYAIGWIGGARALEMLQDAVDASDAGLRQAAMDSLARSERSPAVATLILARLEHESDPRVVAAALSALSRAAEPATVAALGTALQQIEDAGEDGQRHPVWGEGPWASGIANAVLSVGTDEGFRLAIVDALAAPTPSIRAAFASRLPETFSQLEAGGPHARWAVRAAERLLDLALRDPDLVVRMAAASSLHWIPTSTDDLLAALGNGGEAGVRRAAATALGFKGGDGVIEALSRALGDPDLALRVAAGAALARLKDVRQASTVQTMMAEIALGDHDLDLRRSAAGVLRLSPGATQILYDPVLRALRADDFGASIGLTEARLEVLPADVNLRWWYGYALLRRGDPELALAEFERAAATESFARVHHAIAETLTSLERFAEAVVASERAVALAPTDANVHATLAWCAFKNVDLDYATRAAHTALDLDPVNMGAAFTLVLSCVRAGSLAEARSAYTRLEKVARTIDTPPDADIARTVLPALDDMVSAGPGDSAALLAELREMLVGALSA